MSVTLYCTAAMLGQDSYGLALPSDPTQVASVLERSTLRCDAEENTTYQYGTTIDETHDWPLDSAGFPTLYGELAPRKRPIRLVSRLWIETGVDPGTGTATYTPVDVSPVPVSPGQNLPPHTMGQVWIDRIHNTVQPVFYIMLRYGFFALFPELGLRSPRVVIDYTSGYDPLSEPDDPLVVPDDGFSIPTPAQLTEACRAFACAELIRREIFARGFGGYSRVHQGPAAAYISMDQVDRLESIALKFLKGDISRRSYRLA